MYKLTFTLQIRVFICCILGICWSCQGGFRGSEPSVQDLDAVFAIPVDYGKDTVALSQQFSVLIQKAQDENEEQLLWAYYLRMADGHSIASDAVNARSDEFFQKSRSIAEEIDRPELLLITEARNGHYQFIYRKVSDAIPYFLRASALLDEVDLSQVPQLVTHINFLAHFFSYIGDHKRAVRSLERGLPFAAAASRQQIDMYNSMAVYLKRDDRPEDAAHYFTRALEVARQAKDTVWIGIVLGNLANMKYQNGEVEEAIADLKQNIAYSIHYHEQLDAMRSLIELSEIYVEQNRYMEARSAVQQAIPYIEDKPYFLVYKLRVSKLLAKIAHYEGDLDFELVQLSRAIRLQEALSKREDAEHLQRSYWRWKSERDQNTLTALAEEKAQNRIYSKIGLFILFLITVIGGLLVGRFRQKLKTQAILAEKRRIEESFEKQQMGEEIVVLRSSLEEFTNTLKINDLLIQKLKDENHQGKVVDSLESLEDLLDSHLMTDARWLKFKALFDRVHQGYLAKLKRLHPQLTENDLRIIALQKLELSNRSMGDILGISVDGVKKAKQRLKKKLDVDIFLALSTLDQQ
ncbi:tetratricopeptide repeat protein [Sphingobacterium olei]|uniref:Tetratricopeptide repeat protein n=1 Tax=Sphingobacterium olei TaxID=2571155 RepID=A0A4U0NYD7_9SPHI|nr:tetratricopeptide repeat protein [Sphingobacterium olei]TJZ59871.1 tetratricopeptide repeat protein [Sphingobacterium olei]